MRFAGRGLAVGIVSDHAAYVAGCDGFGHGRLVFATLLYVITAGIFGIAIESQAGNLPIRQERHVINADRYACAR